MRASRASSVREAERRRKPVTHSENSQAEKSPDLGRPLRRQERLVLEADSPDTGAYSACSPSVVITPSCGHNKVPTMNTLAAQTACGGGSSRSLNKIGHCECNHDNYGNINNDSSIQNECHVESTPTSCLEEDDVFGASTGTLRSRQEMRWELRYFFMNPYLKYKKRGRKPWKLGVQLLKIIFVTIQLVAFGTSQFSLNKFYEGNQEAFEHLFLKSWSSGFDSKAYPKSDELYAIYEQESFFKHLDYVAYQFSNLKTNAIGTYGYDHREEGEARALHVYQENYKEIKITDDGQFVINEDIHESFIVIPVNTSQNISVKDYLELHNQTLCLDTLRLFKMNFVISSVHLKDSKTFTIPDCIKFNITINYDNTVHSGRMPVSLGVEHNFFTNCSNKYDDDELEKSAARIIFTLDILVLLLCLISMILCLRSIVKAQQLKFKTMKFFKVHYNCKLSTSDRMEFLNLWYVIIVVSDICTITGSVIKILIEISDNTNYDPCSLLLGLGCFLIWFGVLRYLGFFNKYNILIVTLKNAMPNVLRFLICASIIYAAYAFFGWIVLGPYHPKFKTLSISVECMFSLINGDDMYATFREMSTNNTTIYVFSRIYLYTFISLFIYVVLSLIIAVIMDTYETMKEYQRTGHVEGRLHCFMAETCDESIPGRGSFHTQSSMMERWRWHQKLRGTFCCRRCNSYNSDEDMIT
ncbi:mucolipin-3-like [Lytechinus variegatus]|uniref:mucolipin-3-like n=1 Tax=Lytechinus variegatus TaxID=7654 RepID=UPI001BB223EE|nr:mucolipin-3-like [Lytechinus variegatus]